MTTTQAYDPARPEQGGEAAPFLVLTDQTLTDPARPRAAEPTAGNTANTDPPAGESGTPDWLTRPPCSARPIRPGDLVMIHTETGETRPMRCQRNRCPDCIGVNAWRRSLAVRWIEPTHELTVTTTDLHGAAEPWPIVQDRLRVLRQAAKRDHVALGSFGTYLEQGSRTGMTHAHIVVKDGHRLDFDWLRHRLASAGFGTRFTYSRINNDAGFSAYIGKGFATYATKGYQHDAEEALRLNAGRVGHFSRGFFPAGVRRAEVDSLAAAHQTTEPSPWITRIWS